jgi:hypothetical protein
LEFGIGNYDNKAVLEGKGTSFSKQIDNLTAGKDYQVRVKAIANDGAEFSGIATFTTPPLPSISNIPLNQ